MFYRRFLLDGLASRVSRNKVAILFGARQTGKTELLRRVVPAEHTVFFDLAETAVRRRFETDPAAFGREVRALPARVKNVVLDEIQKVPALLDEVQSLYDAQKRRFEIYLTGSSARRLRRHSANLLPGRCQVFRLSPVCRWETERRGSAELVRCGAATRSADLRAARPAVSTAGSRAAQGALQPAHPAR